MNPTSLILIIHTIILLTAGFLLRKAPIDEISRVLWALVIMIVPILGSAVFFIVSPGTASTKP